MILCQKTGNFCFIMVVALGGRDKVQGIQQGAQGAAPSAGSLEAPWHSEHRERAATFALCL